MQTEKPASLGQLTAGIAHKIKNPLNFVNNFSAVRVEPINELRGALPGATSTETYAPRSVRSRIRCKAISTRSFNTASADSIVKNMLCIAPGLRRTRAGRHRRARRGEHQSRLSRRARQKQGFKSAWSNPSTRPPAGRSVSAGDHAGAAEPDSDGFYAATTRETLTDGGGYEPTLSRRDQGSRRQR